MTVASLKPCPFCGGEAELHDSADGPLAYRLRCNAVGPTSDNNFIRRQVAVQIMREIDAMEFPAADTKEQRIDDWNRRASGEVEMMQQHRGHALRMQGAARVLAILAKHHHQTDTVSTIMETLDISADDLEPAPSSFAERAAATDRLIPSLNDIALLRAILEAQS